MDDRTPIVRGRPWAAVFAALMVVGALTFVLQAAGRHPERAWQAYLINFLLFSAVAQGALVFSALMHTTKARWSGPLASLAEAFGAFFPVSLVLFLVLFIGREHVFPWLHHDLHGKEVWLNLPFLFTRDLIGLLVLYGLGAAYLYHVLYLKIGRADAEGRLRAALVRWWARGIPDEETCRRRVSVLAVLYLLAFALILSLIGYDLVMSADPHWYSTLFGAYTFVKAIYLGFGALIILAAVLHLAPGTGFSLRASQFHDIGKLFFAFCLVWADFFYAQFVVIWYGNIPEETHYVILRTVHSPWRALAWTVFTVSFIVPFLILLNKQVKTMPRAMAALCAAAMTGIWLEHFLLLGPTINPQAAGLPLGVSDALITVGFLGLMAAVVSLFLNQFPELVRRPGKEAF